MIANLPEFGALIGEEMFLFIKVVAAILAMVHLLIGLVLFQQIAAVNRMIHAPHGRIVTAVGLVHILLLTAILLLIVFY